MKTNTKKLALAGVLTAVAVVGGTFSVPFGAAKCAPVQHMVNVLAGVLLGPWYALAMAFLTSLIRNLMGTGTLLAFPGSMIGALLCGLAYKLHPSMVSAYFGEVIGTGILGGLAAYPIATTLMGREAAAFGFVVPFLISTGVGALISVLVLTALRKTQVLGRLQESLR